MIARAISLLLIAALGACGKGDADTTAMPATGSPEAAAGEDNSVPCALAGAAEFKADCTLEKSATGGQEIWVVRHPDGGFRRFAIVANGTRIATADGSEEVAAKRVGSELEVRVGEDRYRFPASSEPVTAPSAPPNVPSA